MTQASCVSARKGETVRGRPGGRPSPNGYEGVRCVTLHIVDRVYRPKRCVFLAEVEGAATGSSGAATGPAASERLCEGVLVREE